MANFINGDTVYKHNDGSREGTEKVSREEFEREEARKERKKINPFVRFWRWLKGLFTGKKTKKQEAEKEIKKEYEIKIDETNFMNNGRAFEDYSEEDLYITRDESRLDDYEKQEMRQKKEEYSYFTKERDVRSAISTLESIKLDDQYSFDINYYNQVHTALQNPEVVSGVNKIIDRYGYFYKALELRERSRWERLMTKIFLCYNINRNPYGEQNKASSPAA